ncbi:hypothetical protein D3C85_1346200 [compost metagenome]
MDASSGAKALPGQPMSLMPIIITTVRTPGWDSTSASKRAMAFWPILSPQTRAPEIPAFTTPTPSGARRRARKSGQRRFAPGVEPLPSVSESPNATTTGASGGPSTQIPARKARPASGRASGRSGAALALPCASAPVCCAPQWKVATGVACGK